MAEYINREAAVTIADYAADEHPYGKDPKKLETYSEYNQGWNDACDYIRDRLENEKPADVEPVVRGYWEKSEYRGFVRCSVCRDAYIDEDWLTSGKWSSCPNCRAKMDLAPPEGGQL